MNALRDVSSNRNRRRRDRVLWVLVTNGSLPLVAKQSRSTPFLGG